MHYDYILIIYNEIKSIKIKKGRTYTEESKVHTLALEKSQVYLLKTKSSKVENVTDVNKSDGCEVVHGGKGMRLGTEGG